MNAGSAIMIVGGFIIWLWGMYTPGLNLMTVSACVAGAAMIGYGLGNLDRK